MVEHSNGLRPDVLPTDKLTIPQWLCLPVDAVAILVNDCQLRPCDVASMRATCMYWKTTVDATLELLMPRCSEIGQFMSIPTKFPLLTHLDMHLFDHKLFSHQLLYSNVETILQKFVSNLQRMPSLTTLTISAEFALEMGRKCWAAHLCNHVFSSSCYSLPLPTSPITGADGTGASHAAAQAPSSHACSAAPSPQASGSPTPCGLATTADPVAVSLVASPGIRSPCSSRGPCQDTLEFTMLDSLTGHDETADVQLSSMSCSAATIGCTATSAVAEEPSSGQPALQEVDATLAASLSTLLSTPQATLPALVGAVQHADTDGFCGHDSLHTAITTPATAQACSYSGMPSTADDVDEQTWTSATTSEPPPMRHVPFTSSMQGTRLLMEEGSSRLARTVAHLPQNCGGAQSSCAADVAGPSTNPQLHPATAPLLIMPPALQHSPAMPPAAAAPWQAAQPAANMQPSPASWGGVASSPNGTCLDKDELDIIKSLAQEPCATFQSIIWLPDWFKHLQGVRHLIVKPCRMERPCYMLPAPDDSVTGKPTLMWAKNSTLQGILTLNMAGVFLGYMPQEVARLRSLQRLHLSSCDITHLPAVLSGLSALVELDLSMNMLRELPQQISELQSLRLLDASRNILSEVAPDISCLRHLQRLHLNNNQLRSLPPQLKFLSSLSCLTLSHNWLSGIDHFSLLCEMSLTRLEVSNVSDKNSKLCLAPEVVFLKSLRYLDLSCNALDVDFGCLGDLDKLTYLDASEVSLTQLPLALSKLTQLHFFDLSRNNLTELPPWIGALTALQELRIANNRKLGSLPPEASCLASLRILDMRCCAFLALPPVVTQLPSLQVLSVSSNFLTCVPCELAVCTQLTMCDFAHNMLSQAAEEEVLRMFANHKIELRL